MNGHLNGMRLEPGDVLFVHWVSWDGGTSWRKTYVTAKPSGGGVEGVAGNSTFELGGLFAKFSRETFRKQ